MRTKKKKSPHQLLQQSNEYWELRLEFPASRLPFFMSLAKNAILTERMRVGMIPPSDVETILSRIADRHGNIAVRLAGKNIEDKMWVMLFR
jgi:hypothetical protein